MRTHAQTVLGVPVVFSAAMAWDCIPFLPATSRRTRTSTAMSKDCPAMLMPVAGELFSIYIDERKGMFVQAQDCPDLLFVLQARWSCLLQLLPADSSCLAVAYNSRSGQQVLGVYDVLRVASCDKSALGLFERQALLCELFTKAQRVHGIERHWVGLEDSLLRYVQQHQNLNSVPFEVAHMLRLARSNASKDASKSETKEYELVLRPLSLP